MKSPKYCILGVEGKLGGARSPPDTVLRTIGLVVVDLQDIAEYGCKAYWDTRKMQEMKLS